MNKFIRISGKIILIFLICLTLDVIFMRLLPIDIKTKIYDKRSHKIKSYYYHHDLRPNSHWIENWGWQTSKIYTNNLGFKDKEIRNVKFKENNILFIGDSFTEGLGVEYENSFVGIIENKITSEFDNFTVLNAGLSSYSPIIYLSKLNYLIKKKIPITNVFVVICGGDFYDDIFRYDSIDNEYVVNHGDFVKVKILININNFIKSNTLIYQFIKQVTPISNLVSRFKNKKEANDTNNYTKEQVLEILNSKPDWKHMYDKDAFNNWAIKGLKKSTIYMDKINKLLKSNNIDFTLIYIDEAMSMLNNETSNAKYYENHWQEFSKKNSIDFIFLDDYHENYNDKFSIYKKLFFIGDNHFNNKGNQIVAEEIINKSKYFKNLLN